MKIQSHILVRTLALTFITSLALTACETVKEDTSVLSEGVDDISADVGDIADETAVKATANSAANTAVSAVAGDQLQTMGRDMAAELMKKYPPVQSETALLYLNRVGQYVTMHLDLRSKNIKCANGKLQQFPSRGFRFGAVKSNEKMSMALPGGYIVVSTALIASLKTEDELAGVLAHEATHLACQDGMGSVASMALEKIASAPFSLRQEKVADRGALLALYRSGYFPADYISHTEAALDGGSARHVASPDRPKWLKKDYAKMQSKVDAGTQKSRVARFAEFKKLATAPL